MVLFMQLKEESKIYKNVISVLNHIDDVLLPESLKERKELGFNLIAIKYLLKQGLKENGTINMAKILEALHYIETRKMAKDGGFFSNKSFQVVGDILFADKNQVLPKMDREQASNVAIKSNPYQTLPQQDYNNLKFIHQALWDIALISCNFSPTTRLQNMREKFKPTSIVSYPANEYGEIMNQIIGEWQADMMQINTESPENAYVDFARDITIRGMRGVDNEVIDDLLTYLVDSSDYSDEEKGKMMQWLKCNGGQSNDGFMSAIFCSGQLTNDQPVTISFIESLEYNWSVNNGKIVLNCETVSFCLIVDGLFGINDAKMNLKWDAEPPVKAKLTSPLTGYQVQVELNLDETGMVIPCVTKLDVISFSKNLNLELTANHNSRPEL